MRPPKEKILRRFSQFTSRPVDWLWPARLARGTLALLDGDPGVCKSVLTIDLAARLTSGRPLPESGPARAPCAVVLLNYEDSMESALIPRLEAAGARADLICDFWGKTAEGLARPPIFPDDCDLLAETIEESGAVLAKRCEEPGLQAGPPCRLRAGCGPRW